MDDDEFPQFVRQMHSSNNCLMYKCRNGNYNGCMPIYTPRWLQPWKHIQKASIMVIALWPALEAEGTHPQSSGFPKSHSAQYFCLWLWRWLKKVIFVSVSGSSVDSKWNGSDGVGICSVVCLAGYLDMRTNLNGFFFLLTSVQHSIWSLNSNSSFLLINSQVVERR